MRDGSVVDVFNDVLAAVRLRSTIYFQAFFHPPWGLHVPAQGQVTRFHLASRGGCWIRLETGPPVRLEEGDLVLVPHGSAHLLSDTPDRSVRPLDDVLQRAEHRPDRLLVYGEEMPPPPDAKPSILVCGHLAFEDGLTHPLFTQLPPLMPVRADAMRESGWLTGALEFMRRESEAERPGAAAIANRIAEVFFIQVARAYMDGTEPGARFLGALADPQILRALQAMHRSLARDWSVEELATEAAMSRAAFAARFQALVGQPPIAYLTQWRLLRAAQLLRETALPVKAIARDVGYQSGRALDKAFLSHFGRQPLSFRAGSSERADAR
jgi:AraC-like DNA-binding protein